MSLVKFPREVGMVPVRQFIDNTRPVRELSIPNSWGMEPESWLSLRYRMVRLLKFPREVGMVPVRLFVDNERSVREFSTPNS